MSGMVDLGVPEGASENYVATASALPPATGSGQRYRLGSGLWVVDRSVGGRPVWTPDEFATKPDGTPWTLAWGAFSGKTLALYEGAPQPSVAGGWASAPDLCVDTSGEVVTVDGYALLTGTPPNDEDGFLLVAIPAKTKPEVVEYCHIYCSVQIGATSYRLRVQLGASVMTFGNIPDWSTGRATYEAGVPIYARIFADANLNSILFHPDQWPQVAAWNPALGSETTAPGYVFGLASVSTGGYTPTGETMDWELVGIMVRS